MSDEEICPLCAETLDATDKACRYCPCGYSMCLWCFNTVMETAMKEALPARCPNCRAEYVKENITMEQIDAEEVVKEQQKKKEVKKKGSAAQTSRGLKNLAQVRVVQRNLVYAVGLPLRLCTEEALADRQYFGAYGRIKKISVNRSTPFSQVQRNGPTGSAYVTYYRPEDALRCIEAVDGLQWDGKTIKACFGTTKYCNAFLKGVPCNNSDCLYLHEVAEASDSFSKEDMVVNGLTNGRSTFHSMVHPGGSEGIAAVPSAGSGGSPASSCADGVGGESSPSSSSSSSVGSDGAGPSVPTAAMAVRRGAAGGLNPWGCDSGLSVSPGQPALLGGTGWPTPAAAVASSAAPAAAKAVSSSPAVPPPLTSPLAEVEWPSLGAVAAPCRSSSGGGAEAAGSSSGGGAAPLVAAAAGKGVKAPTAAAVAAAPPPKQQAVQQVQQQQAGKPKVMAALLKAGKGAAGVAPAAQAHAKAGSPAVVSLAGSGKGSEGAGSASPARATNGLHVVAVAAAVAAASPQQPSINGSGMVPLTSKALSRQAKKAAAAAQKEQASKEAQQQKEQAAKEAQQQKEQAAKEAKEVQQQKEQAAKQAQQQQQQAAKEAQQQKEQQQAVATGGAGATAAKQAQQQSGPAQKQQQKEQKAQQQQQEKAKEQQAVAPKQVELQQPLQNGTHSSFAPPVPSAPPAVPKDQQPPQADKPAATPVTAAPTPTPLPAAAPVPAPRPAVKGPPPGFASPLACPSAPVLDPRLLELARTASSSSLVRPGAWTAAPGGDGAGTGAPAAALVGPPPGFASAAQQPAVVAVEQQQALLPAGVAAAPPQLPDGLGSFSSARTLFGPPDGAFPGPTTPLQPAPRTQSRFTFARSQETPPFTAAPAPAAALAAAAQQHMPPPMGHALPPAPAPGALGPLPPAPINAGPLDLNALRSALPNVAVNIANGPLGPLPPQPPHAHSHAPPPQLRFNGLQPPAGGAPINPGMALLQQLQRGARGGGDAQAAPRLPPGFGGWPMGGGVGAVGIADPAIMAAKTGGIGASLLQPTA